MRAEFDSMAKIYDLWVATTPFLGKDINFYKKIAKDSNTEEVIELGVGDGRVGIEIAKSGYQVTGIDISGEMLKLGELKAKKENVKNINFVLDDIKSYTLPKKSKLTIMPFRVFLHLLTMTDKREALINIYNNLDKGGLLVLDVFKPNVKGLKRINGQTVLRGEIIKNEQESTFLWQTTKINIDKQIMNIYAITEDTLEGKVINKDYRKISFSWIEYDQAIELFKDIGFEIINVYGDFNFTPFNQDSKHCVFSLRKPITD
jgi:ubiquinone/menaquinone biosynthesis C-methylase UbiE